MDLPAAAEVVIVGGGVMGASTVWHLARRGCRDVLLLEREPLFGAGATGLCAGGIRYQFSTAVNIRLSQLSLPLLDRFEEEMGQPIDLRRCGYLFLLTREEEVAAFRRSVALQHELGVATEWLEPEDIARLVPALDLSDVLAGTYHARDGLADPGGVVQGYVSGARRLGARLLTGITVTGFEIDNGRMAGVVTDRGRVATRRVVNAAGPWAALIGRLAGIELPIEPVRRQIAVTTPLPDPPADFPMVIDFARALYFHREGPGILTGMSNPDQSPGFDQAVDPEWELIHLEAAAGRLPLLAEAGIAHRWAGLYEVTPDAHPILGRVPGLEGFFCIGGFSGHGFQHGPACGLLLAEEILDGAARSLDITPLSLNRFRERGTVKEYHVV